MMKSRLLIVTYIFAICLNINAGWDAEKVDGTRVGFQSSMKMDSLERMHISSFSKIDDALYYILKDDTGWSYEVVDDNICQGYYSALALDSQERPHIAYLDCYTFTLSYARRDDTGWHTESLTDLSLEGYCIDIVVDSDDFIHISCMGVGASLTYVYGKSQEWEIKRFNDTPISSFTSIAVDSINSPHILHYNYKESNLYYTRVDGDVWRTEQVVDYGKTAQIIVDSSDTAHICYGSYDDSLYYAIRNSTGGWDVELVDDDVRHGTSTSMELDSNNQPHITYHKSTEYNNRLLAYAYRTNDGWHLEDLSYNDSHSQCQYMSLALDHEDYAHITGLDSGNHLCRYIHKNASGWHVDNVNSVGPAGDYSSIMLDTLDHPHISYYDRADGNLKYSVKGDSGWMITSVDSEGDVGLYTSLVIDSKGFPHISYFDNSNQDLKYAYQDTQGWHIETVDDLGDTGYFTSLCMDSNNQPYISYFDKTTLSVKYATRLSEGWQLGTVEVTGQECSDTDIDMAPSNQAWICYSQAGESYMDGWIRIAHMNGSEWEIEEIHDGRVAECSLAIDERGTLHVASTGSVTYLFKTEGGHWVEEEAADGSYASDYVDMNLDHIGRPHIVFGCRGTTSFRYAVKNEGLWSQGYHYETFGALYPTIALDSSNAPHVAFCRENSYLAYASPVNPWVGMYLDYLFMSPGDYLDWEIDYSCNPGMSFPQATLFVLIEFYGEIFCAPSFSEYDYYTVDVTPETQYFFIFRYLPWPEDAGFGFGLNFYAAFTNPEQTEIISNIETHYISWGEHF